MTGKNHFAQGPPSDAPNTERDTQQQRNASNDEITKEPSELAGEYRSDVGKNSSGIKLPQKTRRDGNVGTTDSVIKLAEIRRE